ncbi:acyl-CoA dehydrogenase family protein [Pseudomonas sp. P8_241]|uniref:acyl-CoA dehydrogenase family protein n=1 Tax=Pseudomonas sp. P8_241 TaxID=3043445 RepID=UPI002A36DA5A|nr:acyl-CoA dehydrogenase family protein [Pseudomonas sp. P8_241]WPN45140.1 acyl-CoA dehydrogenase family protein [Pseudomonas sp. P8_241]
MSALAAQLENAQSLLVTLREAFSLATKSLAIRCRRGQCGQLDADLLDRHQVPSYELALASADLLAAETLAKDPGNEARLALVFICEAVQALLTRLEGLFLELDLDPVALQELARSTAWRELRAAGGGAEALQQAGLEVFQRDDELGAESLDQDQDLAMARDSFRRFAEEVVAPQAEGIHRHDLTVPETLLQPLRDMGVFGLSIPQRFGGTAPDDRDDNIMMIVVTEALSQASLAAAGSLITRPEILSRALLAGGTEQQKNDWLPRIAVGEPLCGIAITEPDFGSDVAGLSLRASRCEGGWLLNGAKSWCTFAGKAGLLMVVARTDPDRSLGHKGLSLFLVEKQSTDQHAFKEVQEGGGCLTGTAIPTIGYRGMHSFDLFFDNYFVPDNCLIGEQGGLGKGFYYTMAGMMGGRMQTAARACGVMRAALLAAIRYSGDRKVFAAPLVDYPLTQAKLARMASRFVACRRLTYAVGRLMQDGAGRMEASLVKLLACRSAELITREALQIHGGMGYAEESAVSRYFVDARVLSIFEGAEETLALKVIARSLLENALESA